APAALTVIGFPDEETQKTNYAVKIPYLLGLIATRSVNEKVTGISELKTENEAKIREGMLAYGALQKLRAGDKSDETKAIFEKTEGNLGYGLLLKKYTQNVVDATDAQVKMAASDTIPHVAPMFWTFRIMVFAGFLILFIFAASFYFVAKRTIAEKKWLLRLALYGIPLPWIAAEMGWVVAEYGRQPWTISGILPTHLSTSNLDASSVYFSLAGFIGFYTLLLVAEMYLMFKYARLGPQSLHTGQYGSSARGE
ncbi:MAG: cytochrome ubiquinol oxidase subunit I, partial [Sulfuricella sp.]